MSGWERAIVTCFFFIKVTIAHETSQKILQDVTNDGMDSQV